MKLPFYQAPILFAALFLCFSLPTFAQNNQRNYKPGEKPDIISTVLHAQKSLLANKSQPASSSKFSSDCDNDLTAPEVQCISGNCQPGARAAYLISQYGEPWGRYDNIVAMDAVFGAGNWDALYFENADAATLLSTAYKVIFMEGSDNGGYALSGFLSANMPALENWVAAGGAAFINSAPNYAPTYMDMGFGGVTLYSQLYTPDGIVLEPGHPIFNGPFVPANGDFTGTYFHLGILQGDVGLALITGSDPSYICLSEKHWGEGKVYFGGVAIPSWDAPHPNVDNMWQNILADLDAQCNSGLIIPADAGACSATVLDQSLDATATDDCGVVSLTHDFAGAPDNTTLKGAILPVGNTLVRWTAIDAAGNIGTCEGILSVREPELPAITCPSDISVNADVAVCGAVVSFSALATDNCTAAPTIVTTPVSGGTFPHGETTVVAVATDESRNTSTCSFVVTVIPNTEICNGIDDDCDGWTDEDVTEETTFYLDSDFDGYGSAGQTTTAIGCYPPYGYSLNALDCDDTNYYIRPGMYESCNGIDDNCDGNIDEGVAPTWFADADGDGYGDPNTTLVACSQPQGFAYTGGDCDDTDSYIHPGALEDCTNLVDENCDGILGENNFIIDEIHTDVYCGSNPDGTINLTLSPVQNYPVIHWSNGVCCGTSLTNLQFGTYKVTVSNECGTTKTKTIVIQPSAEPPLQVKMVGTEFLCGGASDGSITATPEDGCGGYTYQWNTGGIDASISGLTGGYYSLIVTDACGCTKYAEFTITQAVQLSLSVGNIIPLLDGTYFVQVLPWDGYAPYKFRRSTPPSGFTDWSSSNGFLGVAPGVYVFEVEDNNGCTASVEITLDPFSPRPMDGDSEDPSGADNRAISNSMVSLQWSVSLFPNPNAGNFTVDLLQPAAPNMAFGITNLAGQLLLEKQIETDSQVQAVNAESLPAGLYFLQVLVGGKVVAVEKFVKE